MRTYSTLEYEIEQNTKAYLESYILDAELKRNTLNARIEFIKYAMANMELLDFSYRKIKQITFNEK